MKLTYLLAAFLLVSPGVSAASVIPIFVSSQASGCPQSCATYPNMGDTTYQFQLANPPFNLTQTNGNYTNESLYSAVMHVKITDNEPITGARTYKTTYTFNGSNTIAIVASFQHQLGSIFGYFNGYYSLQLNGAELCSNTVHAIAWGNSFSPNPESTFDFNLHGSFNSAQGLDFTATNISGEVLTDNPSLFFSFTNDGTFSLGEIFSTNPCSFSTSGTAGRFIPGVFEVTSAPSVTIQTFDSSTKTHALDWTFQNRTVQLLETANQVTSINEQIHSCIGPTFLGLCVLDTIGALLTGILKLATVPLSIIIDYLPGGSSLKQGVGVAWDGLGEIFNLTFGLVLISGPTFPIGGVLWMLTIWCLSLGFLVWGFTGNFMHILIVPISFLKAYGMVVFWLTVGLFVILPLKVIEILAEAIP